MTGHRPELSTTGGTSDARFIKNLARLSSSASSARQCTRWIEHVSVADVERLTDIYEAVIDSFFAPGNVTHESMSGKV